MAEKDTHEIMSLEEDLKVQEYSDQLKALRKDGVRKVADCKLELASLKKNKLIDDDVREKRTAQLLSDIEEAKKVAEKNKAQIATLSKEAVAYVNSISKGIEARVAEKQNKRMAGAKEYYKKEVVQIKEDALKRESKVKSTVSDPKELKSELEICRYELKSTLYDAKNRFQDQIDKAKAVKHQAFVDHIQKNRELRNGKDNFIENIQMKWKNFVKDFKASTFFVSNGLYLAIIVFFIVCVIVAPIIGSGNLFSLPNILTILEQSSTRMFYALGVAGLILLAGTDLSIGRMVALGSVTTGLILHPGMNIVSLFGMPTWNFASIPMPIRVLMALVIAIVLCVIFSSIAGFFTARFKMHPFISTMANQLIIYGALFYGTSGTPVGSIDSKVRSLIGGRWTLGVVGGQVVTFPKLIIPAILAIIVAWLIWNKTTFGKNMYAVGGNSEAAAVSGISVFKVTVMVFVMAGVFYGCGSFLEAFRANASAGTGQGYEMDAIAACVVGGISFNGGIGKIGGAAIGVIIFTSLTYCLTFLGIDTNLQFVFKGIIILAAVSLDCLKYLKKK